MKNIYFWMLTLLCSTLMFSGTNNFTFETQTKGWSMFQTRAFGPDTAFKYDGNFNHVFYGNTMSALAINDYCTSSGNTVEAITLVSFDDFSHASPAEGAPGYEDFTDQTITVAPGSTYPVSFEGNTAGAFTTYFTVFIDWNQNGELDDAGEIFEIGSISNSDGTDGISADGQITVPGFAQGITRMRVVKNFNTSRTDPCGSVSWGQVEDYTINVVGDVIWDCPELEASFGETCDDGNPDTINDIVNENCECEGIVPPAGSECQTAIELTCNAEPSTYSSVGSIATNTTSCTMGSNGLWFSFEGTGGDITVNVSSSFDVEMSVNTGTCNTLENLSCRDQFGSTGTETYTIESTVANQMYYVYVAHYSGSSTTTGDITISIECATPPVCIPPTDVAISDITDSSFSVSWTPGADNITWSVAYGNEGWVPVNDAPIDYADFISQPEHQFTNLDPNTTYDLYLIPFCEIGFGDTMGPYTFTTLAVAPDNDDACGATTLACGDSIEQSLAGATESFEDSCFGSGTSDVWFTFTSDGSQIMTVAETSNFDAVVQLFVGDDCGNLVEAAACKDSPENFTVSEAGTYYFRVRPYFPSGNAGTIEVELTCTTPPENDNPEDAIALECGDSYEGSTAAASQSMGATELCATYSSGYSKDVWFSFEADGISEYTLQGSGFDGVIEVYSGSIGDFTAIDCMDNGGQSDVLILDDLDAGTYYARYFAYLTSSAGDYEFGLTCYTPELCDVVEAGIASSSSDVVCASASFTLTADGSTMDDENIIGLSGQWQTMVDGQWTDIDGATNTSYTVSGGIMEETSYQFVISCSEGNSDTTNTVMVGINPNTSECYCEVNFSSAVEPITYVSFAEIANTSDATVNGSPALEDFTSQTAFVNAGENYAIEVKGNTDGGFTSRVVVYIDWNQDGVFDNAEGSNEMYSLPSITGSTGEDDISSEGTIAVPESAMAGDTRMRVMKKFNSVPTPCNTSGYGQAEDYIVNVSTTAMFDCPELELNFGDSCDDGDATTENDVIGEDCECAGTPIVPEFDCPELGLNIGDACNDGDDSTENDVVTEDCECAGTPIIVEPEFDCPSLQANIGDSCDDGDDTTENDVVTEDCECVGTPIIVEPEFDCPSLQANIGDSCDDGDETTENDVVTEDCECAGTPIIVEPEFDCPNLEANIGDSCDDGDETTENDVVTEDCECAGTPIIVEPEFDCPNLEANIGDSCDDGNDMTENDVVTDDCECEGTPIEQNDMDGDGIPDDIDNCPSVYNPDQADGNGDGIGDACEECDLPYMVELARTSPTTATFNAGNSVWHYQGSANRAGRPLRPYPMYGMNDMTVPHTQYALVPAFEYDVWLRTICDDGSFSPWAGPYFLPTFETGARRTPRMDITPNPAIAIVKISKVEAKTIEVFDMNGGHVKTFNTNDNQFDMTGLPTGKYNLRVIDAEGNIHYDQVIKK